jgi:hypothetical protein
MLQPKATILGIDEHSEGLIARKMLLEKYGHDVIETQRDFFVLWLDEWKKRNQVSE